MESLTDCEKHELKRIMKHSTKVLTGLASEFKGFDNKTNLHAPTSTDPEQDKFLEMDMGVHEVVENTIDSRESARTYWDLKLVKKVLNKRLKKEFGKKLNYKVTTNNVAGHFVYVDVKLGENEHRHIFRLTPFGYVENGQVFNNTTENYISSERPSKWNYKHASDAIREYYDNMSDKSWKE